MPYQWVSEGSISKYNRAVKALKDAKLEVTESAIKELYIKYGGLVMSEDVIDEEEIVAPVKKGKK